MTQVSSPPFGGALEIPRQSEEQKQGAGLTTSFGGRPWSCFGKCVPVAACLSKTKQFIRLVSGAAGQALVVGAVDRDVEG